MRNTKPKNSDNFSKFSASHATFTILPLPHYHCQLRLLLSYSVAADTDSSAASHGYPQANPLGSIHHSTQACYFPCGEEGGHVDRLLADLPDIEFEGPDSHRMRIVAWSLAEANSLTRHEGVITKLPRKVVKREFTTRGCKYSGIFKIVSEFEGPDKSRYRAQGTAFAVNKSHVLTAAHNMWHPKLGPAKNATLFPDARAGMWAQYARKCIAAATSPNWVQVRQVEHDFCMVAVAEPFGPEVHILPCHPSPGPSHVKDGIILGFPLDLPCDAPGRHLIQCKGELSYHVDRDGIAIEHDINTKKGNSGGPVITSGQVVGIHTSFIHCERKNRAIVINRNGNNVDHQSLDSISSLCKTWLIISPNIICHNVLLEKIYKESKEIYFQNSRFMLSSGTPELLSSENIEATLQKFELPSSVELVNYVKYEASKVFLTLASIGKIKLLKDFYDDNFTDDDLPVLSEDPKWLSIRTLNDPNNHGDWECFNKFKKSTHRRHFIDDQWIFLVPYFSQNQFNYAFHANQPLPIVLSEQGCGGEGNFGFVCGVSILAGHHNYGLPEDSTGFSSRNFKVALKSLKANDDTSTKFYEQEKKTLETMRNLKHPHLIYTLAAYERGKDRGFVFPWADGGNLQQLWENDEIDVNNGVLSWALDQMRGIVDGITKLHGEHAAGTRHGDIKPTNILVFKNQDKELNLVIADVGLAKFHTTCTRERYATTTTNRGSRRYEPPEVESAGVAFSRKYDMWSLGCTFLEFLMWLLYGPQGLKYFFHECRECVSDDRYWENGSLRPVITTWMEKLSDDLPHPSAWNDILNLIKTRLLVPDVNFRASSHEALQEIKQIQKYNADIPSYVQIGLPELPEVASARQFQLLKEWIRLCDETHKCTHIQGEMTTTMRMPTRVIDVGLGEDTYLRLIIPPNTLKEKYIALSHCWGKIDQNLKFVTEKGNIDQLLCEICFNRLPRVFQDTVRTTRALGIRYLWIDSLCIIQDDENDWLIEATKMEDVYSCAYVTIAASSTTSPFDGFLLERPKRAYATVMTPNGPLYLAEAIDDFAGDVEGGILNTRGWVLQERALSRRIIHFTSTQIYWECGNGVHCETLAQLRNSKSQFLSDPNFPDLAMNYFKDERIRLIQYLYTLYSALKFTKVSDRPVAISGLLNRLSRTFSIRVDYGIFWKYFERLILWRACARGSLLRIDYTSRQSVPSWSWMAYSGGILYPDIPFGKVEWTGDLRKPFVDESQGGIREPTLTAKARKLTIELPDLLNRVPLDMDIASDFEGGQWKCITVGKGKVGSEVRNVPHYVLLIRPSPISLSHDVYERIGAGILTPIHFSTEFDEVRLI
ncbi:hypothetical protein GQX73_g804 [Xylaria multiplex]|uniref:Protein kinase domain-containing protein n=1 Tax=Xylaria multiplex TaxID=323545 RepID=A0A7C8N475_9PEZI|nr:hypothetical protein GQX73_g804 [Xylaria multiplex]